MRLIIEVPALERDQDERIAHKETAVKMGEPSGSIEAFDQFLDLPHLNVLFGDILRLTHGGDGSKSNL
jgi:hypothetical protein